MKQAAEYRQHVTNAADWALTSKNDVEHKQLMDRAEAWERMAQERERRLAMERNNPDPD